MGEPVDDLRIEIVHAAEQVTGAAALFDDAVDLRATIAFLDDERHHLLIGYLGDQPAGFVTAVELLHPDKPRPEMFLYELGVVLEHRGRGVGSALMKRLIQLCHERDCGEMFVLTDEDNIAAQATYRGAHGEPEPAGVMFHWDWRRGGEPRPGSPGGDTRVDR